jgi:6-pyruvoyltetrahydropterin/6-carboxytetrahydropterin synthase
VKFCAGHRVYGHESKCAHPHGHNYAADIVATADELDDIGRVIDFGVLKERIGGWIDEHWDHAFIYFGGDQDMAGLFRQHPEWRSFSLPVNPTAENMATYLLAIAEKLMEAGTGITVCAVTLEETENCWASVEKNGIR